eukprot:jgi/Botrbrau1/7521/Bobra.0019s0012.1
MRKTVTISQYMNKAKKVRDIGRGTYATVEEWQTSDGRPFAIKRFNVRCATRAQSRLEQKRDAAREVKVLEMLPHDHDHENIVRIIEYIKDGEDYCLVLELVKGSDLFELIQQQETSQLKTDDWYEKVVKLTEQLVTGLTYLHEKGILHFDIKTENLLVTEHGILKICDFGSWREIGTPLKTSHSTLQSTPELCIDDLPPAHVAASDVWSVGCVVFEMLTGQRPFVPDHIKTTREKLSFPLQEFLDGIKDMINMLNRLTSENPMPMRASSQEKRLSPDSDKVCTWEECLRCRPPECIEFLKACWQMDATERPSCSELLEMDFLKNKRHGDLERVPREAKRPRTEPMSVRLLYPRTH